MTSTVSRSVVVAAAPEQVWDLISDLPGMGAYSPENTGGSWQKGATGPAVGAVFRGTNTQGRKSWSTRSVVTRCEPGAAFAFSVSGGGLAVADWSYAVVATDEGCRVTETWQDRRGRLVKSIGKLLTGIEDRDAFTAQSIEQTLARVKERAEQA